MTEEEGGMREGGGMVDGGSDGTCPSFEVRGEGKCM